MPKKIGKRTLTWIIAAVGVVIVALLGFKYWKARQAALPEGIVSGNGRVEAKLVDVSSTEPLKVKEVLVDEGAMVKPGQILVQLDTLPLEAELAAARANVAASEERLAVARASIVKQRSEIDLAQIEVERSGKL